MEQFSDLIHRRVIPVISNIRELGLRLRTNIYLFRFQWHSYIRILNLQSLNLVVTLYFKDVNLSQILIFFFSSHVITF